VEQVLLDQSGLSGANGSSGSSGLTGANGSSGSSGVIWIAGVAVFQAQQDQVGTSLVNGITEF
jgi:hypothetical protein